MNSKNRNYQVYYIAHWKMAMMLTWHYCIYMKNPFQHINILCHRLQLTLNTDIRCFQIHLQIGITDVDAIKVLVIDTNVAFWLTRTMIIEYRFHIGRASYESRIVHHRSKSRFFMQTATHLHATIASAEYDNDVSSASGTSRSKRFTVAKLLDRCAICIEGINIV